MGNPLISILNGASVQRFHTHPTIIRETNGHHSNLVSAIIVVLFPDASVDLLRAAPLHDYGEYLTGDIPSPTKAALRAACHGSTLDVVADLEKSFFSGTELPAIELCEQDKHRLKLADNLAGLLTAYQEVRMGNRFLLSSFQTYIRYILSSLASSVHLTNPEAARVKDWLTQLDIDLDLDLDLDLLLV